MSRIQIASAFIAVSAALFVSGCGGGGNNGNPPAQGDAFVLQKAVYVVPTSGSVTVSAVDAKSVTLSGPVPANVAVGWTLVGNKVGSTQFLRKIASISKANGSTVFQTTAAQLPDIFNDAQIHHIQTIAASVLATMKSPLPGVTFGTFQAKPGTATRDIAYSNKINFSKTAISDAGGLNSVGTIDGELDYSFGFETALDVGVHGIFDLRPKINKFRVAPFLKAEGTLKLTGSSKGTFTKTITIGSPISFPIASIGPVPINLNLQFNLELDGELDVNGVLQVSGNIDMSAGIDCTNDVWSTVQTFDHTFTVTPPNLKAQATLALSAAQPQVSVSIPDIGEMFVKADVLKAQINFAAQTTPPGFNITSKGDFDFTAGGNITLGPFTLFNGQLPAFDLGSFQLGQPIFLPNPVAPESGTIGFWNIPNDGKRSFNTMGFDGSNPHQVTAASVDIIQPDLSRDGKKVVYIASDGSLHVAAATGGSDKQIMAASAISGIVEDPVWSADGTKIAFDGGTGGATDLYVLPSTGGTPTKVSDLTYESRQPSFSPDGTKIAYAHSDGSGDYTIQVLNLTTEKSTPLVTNGSFWEPTYSPDGSTIVIVELSTRHLLKVDNAGIAITNVLTDDNYDHPRYSPDGKQIVFRRDLFNSQIGVANLDGSGMKLFNAPIGTGGWPSWSR